MEAGEFSLFEGFFKTGLEAANRVRYNVFCFWDHGYIGTSK